MNWSLLLILSISAASLFGGHVEDYDEYDYDDDDHEDDVNSTNSTGNNSSSLVFIKSLQNVTVDQDRKSVKLVCEVENLDGNNGTDSKVTFKWIKNEAPIERSKKTTVRNTKLSDRKFRSVLVLKNIDLFDRGFYNCTASNGIDRIRSSALIEVGSEGGRYGSTSSSHNTLKFDSEITTLPPHSIPSVFDAKLLENPNQQLETAIRNGQKTFDLTSSIGEVPGAAGVASQHPGRARYNFSEPFCQVYSGSTCRTYLENKYVFVQPPYTQKDIEQKLSNAFVVISQSNDISSNCNKFAEPSLCYSAFPLCTDPQKINTYQTTKLTKYKSYTKPSEFQDIRNEIALYLRRICKDDCLMLENELCSKEYAIAKRHPVIGQTLELAECELLPDETEASSKNCISLEVNYQSVNKDDTCYWDNGELYRGLQNVSESGRGCIRWSHQFQIQMNKYSELTGHNYCRNPGGILPKPFCYTDQNVRELCNITKCAYVVGGYIVGILFIISLFFGGIIGIFCCRKKSKIARNLQNMNIPAADKNIYGNPGPNSPMEMNTLLPPNIPPQRNHHNSKNGYQSVPQYTYKEVAFIEELGEGAFGKVYKGELKTKTGKIFVAVKSLKENANAKTQADFQREIELISELKHANIICLLGVVVKQEPMCMLFEFMSEGDLHEFLIANSPGEGKSLSQNQFLHIAIQIAQGMEYLSENHYVHRDLAARNCLVSKDLVVKISDFGLSRDMYSCDYYRVQSKSLLPVRWMPPESILYGKFTTESDVWSYGVVLWEIYSYGLQPYYGRNNQEVINMIRYRELLPCPEACPSSCYSLMVECWAELAIRRPSFGEISHRLRVWKQNGNTNGGGSSYFANKTPENHPTASSSSRSYTGGGAHGSKSSHTSESSPTVIGAVGGGGGGGVSIPLERDTSWERSLTKSGRMHESQSSLTSRSSSLGNKTQSTSLSNEHNSRHRSKGHHHRRNEDSLDRPKNTVVSSRNGDFEIKITH